MSRGMFRSLLLSLALHGILAVPVGFGLGFAADARTDVIQGVSSIELEHVSPLAEPGFSEEGIQPVRRSVSRESAWFDDGGAFQNRIFSGLRNPAPRYPWSARVNGWQGTVFIRVRVTPEGRVASLEVNKSSGYPVLDSAALEAIRRWEFIPARQESRKVASIVEIPITFLLKNEQ